MPLEIEINPHPSRLGENSINLYPAESELLSSLRIRELLRDVASHNESNPNLVEKIVGPIELSNNFSQDILDALAATFPGDEVVKLKAFCAGYRILKAEDLVLSGHFYEFTMSRLISFVFKIPHAGHTKALDELGSFLAAYNESSNGFKIYIFGSAVDLLRSVSVTVRRLGFLAD